MENIVEPSLLRDQVKSNPLSTFSTPRVFQAKHELALPKGSCPPVQGSEDQAFHAAKHPWGGNQETKPTGTRDVDVLAV